MQGVYQLVNTSSNNRIILSFSVDKSIYLVETAIYKKTAGKIPAAVFITYVTPHQISLLPLLIHGYVLLLLLRLLMYVLHRSSS
ncbi:hypothetical protein IGA_02850 [Bacillus cereus HuA3-9]|uniref:Uncharacterized protein n=1 Tax=Bacillus cereus HuA3-9 TaxID=1053205 RepID=R8D0Z6_BACCE|nr:hypothetical protein IGA_02850 [Bacillus cereus HuA3-9]